MSKAAWFLVLFVVAPTLAPAQGLPPDVATRSAIQVRQGIMQTVEGILALRDQHVMTEAEARLCLATLQPAQDVCNTLREHPDRVTLEDLARARHAFERTGWLVRLYCARAQGSLDAAKVLIRMAAMREAEREAIQRFYDYWPHVIRPIVRPMGAWGW